ncbi:MAG: DUF1003 domain-containing protein [Chthonomonadales bacterium]
MDLNNMSTQTTQVDQKQTNNGQFRSVNELTQRNIETIAEMERSAKAERSPIDKITDLIAAFCGSTTFVWVHIIWFGGWLVLNLMPIKKHFDPFPFSLLTLVVSLESIFLTVFVLISQNQQGVIAERRNHLDLQVNLIAEQENSKMLSMLKDIMDHLGIENSDPEVEVLREETRPDQMAQQIKETIEQTDKPKDAAK